MRRSILDGSRKAVLSGGVSLITLAALAVACPAWAADAAGDADAPIATASSSTASVEQVVVVGVRKSLESAQKIKETAETVVDSINATDIGAFPDKSVAEALQRVPGITVSRLQSSDDSSHFSAEPAAVLIRGLTQVRTEFNGRDSFSADASRGLNFNDISPELMAGIDAYKNETADMIEGGIAGTVNLRTRLPFDATDQLFSGSLKGDYGDRGKKTTYEYSGIIAKTWDTELGRIGVLANYADSHVLTRTEGVVMQRIGTFCSAGFQDASGTPIVANSAASCTASPYGGSSWQYMPSQVNFSQVDYDRKRHGTSLAFQWENNPGTLEFTAQYNDSFYRNAWLEKSSNVSLFGLFGAPAYNPLTNAAIGPAPGSSPFVFGPNGMLVSGVLTQPTGDWGSSTQDNINRGSAVPGLPFVNYCGAGASCATQREGIYVNDEGRNFNHSEGTQDLSANLKWKVTDNLRATFDAQYIKAETKNYDILVAAATMANAQYSVNGDGTPQITLLPGSNVNYAPGGLTNPHNYYIPYIQDHYERNKADELALRADGVYDFAQGGWLNSLNVGVRYAERTQKVHYSTYNWSPVSAPWNCNGPGFNADNTTSAPYPAACGHAGNFQGYGAGIWSSSGLGSFYNGSVFPNPGMVFLSQQTLADQQGLIKALSQATTNSPLGWTPLCQRTTNTVDCFTAPEILDVTEKTTAAYAMLRFGGDDTTIFNGITVQGNVGVRFVRTDLNSSGGVAYPNSNWYQQIIAHPCTNAPLPSNTVVNPACYATPALLAFSNSGSSLNTFGGAQNNWLPSFNLRLGVADHQFVRFAASRALSRPDFGLLRNFANIQSPVIDVTPNSTYVVYNSPTAAHIAANVTGYNFVFNADSGYGALHPITADQFDIAYENYFNKSSSFTVDFFYKKLNGSIAYGEFTRSFTNNGVTENVTIRGPRNASGGGNLSGVEVAYQTFFDFLPGLWSGLGMQVNYTHTIEHGINNSNLATEPGYAAGGTIGFGGGLQVNGTVIDSHRLAGISDDAYNVIGLYEKGPVAMRLAYNWRSDFLSNNLDCCIGLPMWQKAAGFLDGSIRYRVSPQIELSLEGSNLLNTTTIFQQQVFGDSKATPGAAPVKIDSSWIRSDRRIQFGVRFKY